MFTTLTQVLGFRVMVTFITTDAKTLSTFLQILGHRALNPSVE